MAGRLLDLVLPPRATERLVRELKEDGLSAYLRPQARTIRGLNIAGLLIYDEEAVRAEGSTKKGLSLAIRTDILTRTRDTLPQTTLGGRGRRRNISGTFQVTRELDPEAPYVLLDDVTTTGATLLETVRALRAAGARSVTALALAYQDWKAAGNAVGWRS